MSYQQYRENLYQFFTSMFIATFTGAICFTLAGHFLIRSFTLEKAVFPGTGFLLVPLMVLLGVLCYVLPWIRIPIAREAFDFWFKGKGLQTKAANLVPYLMMACMPFALAVVPIIQAVNAGTTSYQGPLFVAGAFAFFGMSILQSFMPLRVYFRKNFSPPVNSKQKQV